MKYLADVLTASRFVMAVAVFVCILQNQWLAALWLFALAAITDALDGYCARRWPYSPEDTVRLWWRRFDPHMIDNLPDGAMVAFAAYALALRLSYWWWLVALIYGVSALFMIAVQLLARRGLVRAAETVDVVYGWWFAANIAMVLIELARRADHLTAVLVIGLAVALPIVWFKRDRALTRPETRHLAEQHAAARRA